MHGGAPEQFWMVFVDYRWRVQDGIPTDDVALLLFYVQWQTLLR